MDIAIILIVVFAAGVVVGRSSRFVPTLLKRAPEPIEVTHWQRVPDAKHSTMNNWIATVRWSDDSETQFRSHALGVTWQFYPSGTGAGYTLNRWLEDRLQAHRWELQARETR